MPAHALVNVLDITSPGFIANPYPAYQRLRQHAPVCWDEGLRYWLISRYKDVHALLRDKRCSSDQFGERMGRLSALGRTAAAPLREVMTNRLIFTDEPVHHRIRSLMQQAFTPRRLEMMRVAIQAITDRLLDRVQPLGRMDLIADFAEPLPALVIATMLGLPLEDRHRIKAWTDDIYGFFDFGAVPLRERVRQGTASARRFKSYLTEVFAAIRRQPRDDLLSALVAAAEQGDRLTEPELLSNVVGLLNGSHDTTTNLLGNTLFALLRHPEQWRRLLEEPSLVPNAVEEGLRYDSPVQMILRRATMEVPVGEATIPSDGRVMLMLGSANRDPEVFADPDQFDVTRAEINHVSFGGGPHYCLGAAIGRLEGQVGIETLCRRLPRLRLAEDEVRWRPRPIFRGLCSLPVLF
jgi:cytochrome P450